MDRDTIKKLLATLQEATRLVESMMDTEFPHGEVPGEPVAQEITLEQVRALLAEKSQAGFTSEVRGLLEKYGAPKLSLIDPANYKALMADAEQLQ
jgi:hypothetical protein